MASIRIIYASTSGHTEHVVAVAAARLRADPGLEVSVVRAELARPADLLGADLVVLASGTWNYGGREGQLNEHMHRFLSDRSKGVSLTGRRLAFVSLGDDRYYFTTRCTEGFMRFLRASGAAMAILPLTIVNEPYGQEDKIRAWADKLQEKLLAAPAL